MAADSELLHALKAATASVEQRFKEARRVLSFEEYLDVFAKSPDHSARDASRYVRDAFDHFGTSEVEYPWGKFTRYRLFDLPWEPAEKEGALPTHALIGQEQVQEEIYRALSNFAREGRPSRLILLHGPNGSAKSTIVGCILRALEHYSQLDDGALYCFNWVFPSTKSVKGALGFGQPTAPGSVASYAHLPEDQLDTKLAVEVRDHPLFLFPIEERREFLKKVRPNQDEPLNDWILNGRLSHKSQKIFEALLAANGGSFTEVLRHVQVERYFISQRYRVGAVTIGPQMSVDAGERQITMDRSIGALPASLQAVSLYETTGELVDAAGGVLEFSDLLKRPLDTFKYLQLSIETGEVALSQQNIQLNCVMMGSANELHLDAFREHPEFASFRGRLELLRTAYLRSYLQEQTIYDAHIAPQVRRHVAPHATLVAALFATLTRMRKPKVDRYKAPLDTIATSLTAMEKLELYSTGRIPERLEGDAQRLLRASVRELFEESDTYPIYEGRVGASPREMRVVILDAAQSPRFKCLSPIAVLEEIKALCERRNEFEWLQQDSATGHYHDVVSFQETLVTRLLDTWEHEFYASSGIINDDRYLDLFKRYITNVSVWLKKERIRNRATGEYEAPDENLMREVERLLGSTDADTTRQGLISAIAAWAIDHPTQDVDPAAVFPHHLKRLREAVFGERRPAVAARARDIGILVREEGVGLDGERRREAQETLDRLIARFGYCENCASDAAAMLLARRMKEFLA